MEHYYDAKHTVGSPGALDYEQAAEGNGSGYVVGRVQVTLSDLIADVEITARRSLSPRQLAFFKKHHMVEQAVDKSELSKMMDIDIQEILGAAFIENGMSPIKGYMRSIRV